MTLAEHLQELEHRTRLTAWVVFLACTVLYLLPVDVAGTRLVGDTVVRFGRLTRLTWTVFGALLLTWPLWIYHVWQFVAPGLSRWERREFRFFLFILFLSLYLTWYIGGRYLWPWLQAELGQHQGLWVWFGLDSLSLLLKAELLSAVLVAAGVSSYRRILTTRAFWVSTAASFLIPPYLLVVFLLLFAWSNVWFSLSGRWRLISLVLPIAIGRAEVLQGVWPWGAVILSGIFLGTVALAPIFGEAAREAIQEQQREERRSLVELIERLEEPRAPQQEPTPPPKPPEPEVIKDQQTAQAMVTHLTHALAEDNPTIRCQALNALGQIGSQDHIKQIVPFLQPGEMRAVRLTAIEALGMIGGEQAVDALLALLEDGDPVVRWRAREILENYLLAGKKLPTTRRPVTIREEPLVRVLS